MSAASGSGPESPSDPYPHHRPNVGIVLFNRDGLVWLGRRANTRPPHAWQFPQGGIDKGEDVRIAAFRELEEETGVSRDKVDYLGETPGWIAYDYPPKVAANPPPGRKAWKGQKQRWFALRFLGEDGDFDLSGVNDEVEFDAWRWGRLDEAPGLIIPWKRPVYEAVAAAFKAWAAP